LALEGAQLTLLGRDIGRLEALDLDAELVTGDLRDPETSVRAAAAAVAEYGRLDSLVVASGVVAFGQVGDLPDEALVDLFLVNTLAPVRLLRAALPHLVASARDGRSPFIVNVSAVVAEQPTAGMAAYSASKAALTAYDVAAGRELRRAGIRLIDARPPHTETGLAERPLAGTAPRLPPGLDPDAVAARVIAALLDEERDLPSTSFG
ncbi:MAG: SDR family oxidoreductase, partial [Actinomycetes bacterium]